MAKQKIKQLLELVEMTPYQLSQETNIDFDIVNYVLTTQNKKFNNEELKKIADFFCVKYEWLEGEK